jgi:hypothetical protein
MLLLHFRKAAGTGPQDPRIVEMLLEKARQEFEETMQQWKQKGHLMLILQPEVSAPDVWLDEEEFFKRCVRTFVARAPPVAALFRRVVLLLCYTPLTLAPPCAASWTEPWTRRSSGQTGTRGPWRTAWRAPRRSRGRREGGRRRMRLTPCSRGWRATRPAPRRSSNSGCTPCGLLLRAEVDVDSHCSGRSGHRPRRRRVLPLPRKPGGANRLSRGAKQPPKPVPRAAEEAAELAAVAARRRAAMEAASRAQAEEEAEEEAAWAVADGRGLRLAERHSRDTQSYQQQQWKTTTVYTLKDNLLDRSQPCCRCRNTDKPRPRGFRHSFLPSPRQVSSRRSLQR